MDGLRDEEQLFKIGEIAAVHGVSVRAMRLYEKLGVIKPHMVDEHTGYRFYSIDQVRQIQALMELQALGFSLVEIKDVLTGGMDAERFRQALIHKQVAFHDAIAAARYKLSALERMLANLENAAHRPLEDKLTDEERGRLLAQMVCVENTRADTQLSEAIWV